MLFVITPCLEQQVKAANQEDQADVDRPVGRSLEARYGETLARRVEKEARVEGKMVGQTPQSIFLQATHISTT